MFDPRIRKGLDFALLLSAAALVLCGLGVLYSIGLHGAGRFVARQVLWAVIGAIAAGLLGLYDYHRLQSKFGQLYGVTVVLLLVVLVLGRETKGATRWIPIGNFQFQPSEFAKLALIICLAVYLQRRFEHIRQGSVVAGSLVIIGVPALLVLKQPDLGTTLVLGTIWLAMTFIAGARLRHLAVVLFLAAAAFGLMWRLNILRDFQKDRLVAFVNPEKDPRATGYHVIQARIAVGSGQLWGRGFGRGTQSHGDFIPEKQTDFIFTVLAEETGFAGSMLVVGCYAWLLLRGCLLMATASDVLGRLLAAGVVGMFSFQAIVNIGMTIGINPVTGVPLPFLSYGGSAMIVNMAALGLLLAVGIRRQGLVF